MRPTSNWKDIVEVIGIAALVASLIFVGLQMKQTREIAIGAAQQARADSEISQHALIHGSEALQRVFVKQALGEPLTDFEATLRKMHFNPRLIYYENAHFQWEQGLATDDYWHAQREGLKDGGFKSDLFREFWLSSRGAWRPSFAQVVDEVLLEIEADKNQ